jgi:hypothetical protein
MLYASCILYVKILKEKTTYSDNIFNRLFLVMDKKKNEFSKKSNDFL